MKNADIFFVDQVSTGDKFVKIRRFAEAIFGSRPKIGSFTQGYE
jgi:hypothetical protein